MSRIVLILLLTVTAHAQINETFSGSSLPPGWTASGGTATVGGGVLTLTNSCVELPGTFNRAGGMSIEFDVRMTAAENDMNVWALYDSVNCGFGPNNGYSGNWYPVGGSNITDGIGVFSSGQATSLGTTPVTIPVNQTRRVRLEFRTDGTVAAYISGVEILAALNQQWTQGKLSIHALGTNVIDNLMVTSGPPPAISVSVSPSAISLFGGQTQQFTATVTGTANTAVTWSVSPQTGSISGTGLYTAPAIVNSAQAVTITAISVADPSQSGSATVSLQPSNCTYSLSPVSGAFSSSGGTGSITVTAAAGCPWSSAASDGWLTITGGSSGTGTGAINYTVAATSNGTSRSATISVAGQTHTVTQTGRGCSAGLSPARISQGAASASVNVSLTMSAADCPWTAASNASWVTVSPQLGIGDTTVRLQFAGNAQASGRSGTVTIAGLSLTVTQAGSACTSIAISQSSEFFGAAGGGGNVIVSSPAGCPFTVASGSSFVIVTSGGGSRTSGGTVTYTVQPNTGGAPRTGAMTIGPLTVTISQAGNAAPNLSCAVVNVSNPPSLRSTGRTELLSDLDVNCTGRSGGAVVAADVVLTLNVNVTNRVTAANTETTDAKLVLASGGTIAGRVEGINAVRFAGVPISNGEPDVATTFRISQVRADTTGLGTPALQSGLAVSGVVTMASPIGLPVLQATQTLGVVRQALVVSRGGLRDGPSGNQKILPIVVQEAFPANFRTRDGESGGSAADTGTRLRLAISSIPLNAQVYAAVASVEGGARLVSANAEGAGGSQVIGSPRADGTYQQMTIASGATAAFWEITNASATALDSATLQLLFENASAVDLEAVKINASFAPFSDDANASATAAIPRFANPASTAKLVNLRISGSVQTGSRPIEQRSPVTVGNSATITYRINNDSDERADGVTVRATLPEGMANTASQPTQGNCTSAARQVRCELGSVAASAQASVIVVANVSGVTACPNCLGNGSLLESTGTVASTQADTDVANNSTEAGVEIGGACQFTLSRTVLTAQGAASELKVDVATGPNCDWTVSSQNSVTVAPAGSLRGSATLTLAVPQNTGAAERTLSLTLGGQALSIVQAGLGCTTTLTPPASISATGGTFQVQVTTACGWKAVGGPDWLRVNEPSSGQGNGVVSITIQPNPTIGPRAGSVEVMGRTVAITQPAGAGVQGCVYALSQTQFGIAAGGGSGTVQVTTGAGCTWGAIAVEGFLTITSGASGAGTGTVSFTAAANTGGQRTGTIAIAVAGLAVSVTQAGSGQATGLRFVALDPCRLVETRSEYNFQGRTGAFGPPYLRTGETRTLAPSQSNVCQVPVTAKAFVLNVTLVPRGVADFVTLWPAGESRPEYWTARSPDGQVVANSAIVKAGSGGAIQIYSSNDVDVVVDISGYFTDSAAGSNLVFYPLAPCRVVDTRALYRAPSGAFGPPSMNAMETRRVRFPASPFCNVPAGASAYSATITAVPDGPLQFLAAWPSGRSQPNVSNINSPAGRVLANSVILPASADGSIDVFTFDHADFLMDVNGYFAPDNGQGLFYFPVTQCRALDTRGAAGVFGGPAMGDESTRTLPLSSSACAVPGSAKAIAANATVLPGGAAMPFLTMFATGEARPNASSLNAFNGQIATNSAIVPAGAGGSVNVFTYRATHVVVEVSGYFGR